MLIVILLGAVLLAGIGILDLKDPVVREYLPDVEGARHESQDRDGQHLGDSERLQPLPSICRRAFSHAAGGPPGAGSGLPRKRAISMQESGRSRAPGER